MVCLSSKFYGEQLNFFRKSYSEKLDIHILFITFFIIGDYYVIWIRINTFDKENSC